MEIRERTRISLSAIMGAGAGLADSAASAATTLIIGISAIRILPSEGIALYSLLMTGFITSMLIPQQLIFFPVRIQVNLSELVTRPALIRDLWSARYALIMAMLSVMLFGLPMASSVGIAPYLLMSLTAAFASVTGSLQTHIRSSMHVLGHHKMAGACSITALVVTIVGLGFLSQVKLEPWMQYAVPFGLLVTAYCLSAFCWAFAARRTIPMLIQPFERLRTRALYVAPDVIVQITWYGVSLLVVVVLGSSALTELEGARVAAAPVFILASGISSFAVPTLLRSISQNGFDKAYRQLAFVQALIAVGGLLYAVALATLGGLLSRVFQRPVDPVLSGTRAFASGVEGTSNTLTSAYVVTGKAGQGVLIVLGSCLLVLIMLVPLLLVAGIYAVPICQASGSAVRTLLGSAFLRRSAKPNHPSLHSL